MHTLLHIVTHHTQTTTITTKKKKKMSIWNKHGPFFNIEKWYTSLKKYNFISTLVTVKKEKEKKKEVSKMTDIILVNFKD